MAAVAAVLAIVISLAIASGLNDLRTTPASAGAPTSHAAVHASTLSSLTSNPFTHSPFTAPFAKLGRLPWPPTAP